jgi:hypothetical protein
MLDPLGPVPGADSEAPTDAPQVRGAGTAIPDDAGASSDVPARTGRGRTIWASVRAAIGSLLGLVPHVMHHIGILAGAALLTGVWGNSLFYAVGLVLSIPLIRRLRKRFGTWKAPAVAVAVFTALFLLSALVLGPAISRTATSPSPQTSVQSAIPSVSALDHASHHGG